MADATSDKQEAKKSFWESAVKAFITFLSAVVGAYFGSGLAG